MKMNIYKYVLLDILKTTLRSEGSPYFEASAEVPIGSTRLKVDKQGSSQVCLWAMVNPEETKKELHHYLLVMTGGPAPANSKYMNTLLFDNGAFVLHVFEALQ